MRREIIGWFQRTSHLQTHWAWVVWPRLGGFFGFHQQKLWYRSIEQINPPVSSNVLEDPWFIDNCPIQSHSHRPIFSGISMGFSWIFHCHCFWWHRGPFRRKWPGCQGDLRLRICAGHVQTRNPKTFGPFGRSPRSKKLWRLRSGRFRGQPQQRPNLIQSSWMTRWLCIETRGDLGMSAV